MLAIFALDYNAVAGVRSVVVEYRLDSMSSNAIFARNPEAAVSQSAPSSIQALPLSHPPANPIFPRDFPSTLCSSSRTSISPTTSASFELSE
jgi:hypothetical protein